MHPSRRLIASVFSLILVLPGALPASAKDTSWQSDLNAGTKAALAGDYSEADSELDVALRETAKFQTNDKRLAETYYQVGQLRLDEEKWSDAKQYFERALAIQEKLGDPQSIDIGNTLSGLANAHEQLGDHEMAVLLLKRVRTIWTKQYGAHDKRLSTVLPAMATYAMLDSDYATAQDCYRQLVSIEEAAGAEGRAGLGSALESLASSLAYVGKYAEAEPIAERAVTVLTEANDTPTSIDSANADLQYIEQRLGKASPTSIPSAAPASQDKAQPAEVGSSINSVQQIARKQESVPVSTAAKDARQLATKQITHAPVSTSTIDASSSEQVATKHITSAPLSVGEANDANSSNKTITTKQVTGVLLASKTSGDQKIKPWELPTGNKQLIAGKLEPSESAGKIQYLAGGHLISPEQYKAMMLAKDAYELIREDKFTMAIEILKNALATYPDLASAHANLGLAYTQVGQASDAVAHLRQAIAIDATRAPAWLNLASAFQMNGQLKDAVATYSEFVQRFPNQPLVGKVQDITAQLDKELTAQAEVEKTIGAQGSASDYLAYASHGGTLRWPANKNTIKVYLATADNLPGFKPEYAGFFTDSFKQWQAACREKVQFQFLKTSTDADIECLWTDDATKISSPSEGGETNIAHGAGNISHATITILTKRPGADSALSADQVRAVCLHEIGHVLGLVGHSPKPQDVMYCSVPPASVKVPISERDATTIQKLYDNAQKLSWVQ
jgi:tetratricopeptide (TPR) repeat protein